jgi:alkanesulfonate monooxygenase SsuD/methylene tetrahydromethanopterin reductase-like flavin-dependent oxidoreductase (luciferase family)
MTDLGIMFRREHAPEHLPAFAARAEGAGFDSLWLVEDCFYGSGIASAATALASTGTIKVGLGIMPAVARNPVFTAMEIATLARLFPGRFLPGIGHGVAGWMRQIGAMPNSQLRALEETTLTVRRLLAGEEVSYTGREVQLQKARLLFPPDQIPPVFLGVRGPKSLALSGRVADGTILAEFASPAYLSWAREQIDRGRLEAWRDRPHRLTVFAFVCLEDDIAEARRQLNPLVAAAVASGKINTQIAPLGILPAAEEMLADGGPQQLEAEMPDEWIDQLNVVGSPEACAAAIGRLVEAGADSVVLVPLPDKGLDELDLFAGRLLPLLS